VLIGVREWMAREKQSQRSPPVELGLIYGGPATNGYGHFSSPVDSPLTIHGPRHFGRLSQA
jgi:hypothetical protein